MNHFFELYAAGSIKRWHVAHTIKEQDLAAHSWGVALICAHIEPGNERLMLAALVHDLAESETGDIPYQIKQRQPSLAHAAKEVEAYFNHYHDIEIPLSEHEVHCLKWADMFELYLWCVKEIGMGNQYMISVRNRATEALVNMKPPNLAATILWERRNQVWNNQFKYQLQSPALTPSQE